METFEKLKLADNGKNTSIKQLPKFENIVTSVEDAECFVSPSTSKTYENVDLAMKLVLENRRIKISDISNM